MGEAEPNPATTKGRSYRPSPLKWRRRVSFFRVECGCECEEAAVVGSETERAGTVTVVVVVEEGGSASEGVTRRDGCSNRVESAAGGAHARNGRGDSSSTLSNTDNTSAHPGQGRTRKLLRSCDDNRDRQDRDAANAHFQPVLPPLPAVRTLVARPIRRVSTRARVFLSGWVSPLPLLEALCFFFRGGKVYEGRRRMGSQGEVVRGAVGEGELGRRSRGGVVAGIGGNRSGARSRSWSRSRSRSRRSSCASPGRRINVGRVGSL